jgi:hypothetical protein
MKIQINFCIVAFLLLVLPAASLSDQLETKFGPILYDTSEQLVAYGRSLGPENRIVFSFEDPSPEVIAARHEYLFERVCDQLDIILNGLRTSVRLVTSIKELQVEYRQIVPESTKVVNAFYSHRDKTIWYAQERMSRGLALHETAHAVIDHYFIQALPAGVDEFVAEKMQQAGQNSPWVVE